MTGGVIRSRHGAAVIVLFNAAAILLLLLCSEGAASILHAFYSAFHSRPVAERFYATYDPELGWVSIPNACIANAFGTGKPLRINSQGFRGSAEFAPAIPPGKVRILCTGDSFTFGYGVDDDHTWPECLGRSAPDLETVNMGQAGYGVDQSYLWFRRDGIRLKHDIHVLAFIFDDFRRMQMRSFNGFGKPVLVVDNGELVARNVPVPRSSFSPLIGRVVAALGNLNVIRMVHHSMRRGDAVAARPSREADLAVLPTLEQLLDHVLEVERAAHAAMVLVYLPVRDESAHVNEPWRPFLADYARQHDLLFIDLADDFHRLTLDETNRFFIPEDPNDPSGPVGHYTAEGNAYVADLIYQRLLEAPQTSALLKGSGFTPARRP